MKIKVIDGVYAVCKLKKIPESLGKEFYSLTITDEEISLVCAENAVPQEILDIETGFSMLRIEGQLDFSLIGILADISGVLAQQKISIFCISTYNTDYVLVRRAQLEKAIIALSLIHILELASARVYLTGCKSA